MKRFLSCLVAALALLSLTGSAQAQVPTHSENPPEWAHEAVTTLQKDGIMIGYPDGYFRGNRAMTRYEFAIAMKRALETIASTHSTHLAASNDHSAPMVPFHGDFFTRVYSTPSRFTLANYSDKGIVAQNVLPTQLLTPGNFHLDFQTTPPSAAEFADALTPLSSLRPILTYPPQTNSSLLGKGATK